LEIFSGYSKTKLLVESGEILEIECTNLIEIMFSEKSIKRSTLAIEALVELDDPILKNHSLKASFRLKLSGIVSDSFLKTKSTDGQVFAFILEGTAKFVNLILRQSSLELLQSIGEFPLVESSCRSF
jgi:hypothetical protein